MGKIISGIQQIGVGVSDVYEAWNWYRKNFGFDINMFDEAAEANLMLPYTNNEPQQRHAILALNMKGGGGLEIWEYKSRTPQNADFEIELGDLGIFITKMKTENIQEAFKQLQANKANILSEIVKSPTGTPHFYLKDPWGNILEVEEANLWNLKLNKLFGGNSGVVLGVADIEKSMNFYSKILGYDQIIYDKTENFDDYKNLPGGDKKHRRVLLGHSVARKGAFGGLLGPSTIELVSTPNKPIRKIYKDRLWGDLGYIHLCFDITDMDALKKECESIGHPFTVDSADSFDMGEAAGHFSYIEDPDGTLIEFIETHKIPILKKIGWFLDLRKRDRNKALPQWFFKIIQMTRTKN
jgi:catechol 2,3-dioxygenase-like lactoylglutathione lyase family enzyme